MQQVSILPYLDLGDVFLWQLAGARLWFHHGPQMWKDRKHLCHVMWTWIYSCDPETKQHSLQWRSCCLQDWWRRIRMYRVNSSPRVRLSTASSNAPLWGVCRKIFSTNDLNCGTTANGRSIMKRWKFFWPHQHNHHSPPALLISFSSLQLLPPPQNQIQAEGSPFCHTGLQVSLHKVITSKGAAARFKSGTVLACYRHSLWTFWSHLNCKISVFLCDDLSVERPVITTAAHQSSPRPRCPWRCRICRGDWTRTCRSQRARLRWWESCQREKQEEGWMNSGR